MKEKSLLQCLSCALINYIMKTKMKKVQILILLMLLAGSMAYAREYHVSTKGNDAGTGTEAAPFRTINRAAQAAYTGDVITVHSGTYREWVNPPRGGNSDDKRIV
jgi:hypothetical protein